MRDSDKPDAGNERMKFDREDSKSAKVRKERRIQI